MGHCENMDNKNELLCSYASLILANAEMDVTADNINSLVKASGASVPSFYPALFEKASKVGSGGGGAAPAGAKGGAPAAAAKKEESEEEEEMAPAADIFGGGGDDY